MLADMSGGVLVVVGTGLITGILLLLLGQRLTLGAWRTWVGAGAAGLLASLVAGDLAISGAARWWAAHPTVEAAATGLLLLALTVLVVEAVVQRALAASETRRWRPAASIAAAALLDNAVAPMQRTHDDLDAISDIGRIKRMRSDEWPPSAVSTLLSRVPRWRAELNRVVLGAAPVLTATDDFHRMYDHVLAAVEAVGDLEPAIEDWYRTGVDEEAFRTQAITDEEWQRQFSETEQAWRSVLKVWATALEHLRGFEREAVRDLAVSPPAVRPWEPERG